MLRQLPQGTIEYETEITHIINVRFKFKERLAILFGSKVIICSTAYIREDGVTLVGQETSSIYVESFRNKAHSADADDSRFLAFKDDPNF